MTCAAGRQLRTGSDDEAEGEVDEEEGSRSASAGTSFNEGVRMSWAMTMETQCERPTLNCARPGWLGSNDTASNFANEVS